MKNYNSLVLEKDGPIAVVSINRPQALNALNTELLEEIGSMMIDLEKDADVRAIIITGAGEKAFVAGADISEMSAYTQEQAERFGIVGNKVAHTIEKLSKPVIAAVNGFALGGGCELAMACDIRVASVKAKFGQPEVGLGITPGFGGTQRMPRLVGKGMAKLLILSAKTIRADEAYRIGLVDVLAEPEELLGVAKGIANDIASKSSKAVEMSKKAVNEGLNTTIEQGTDLEAKYFGECFTCSDQKEGMAAFLAKRAAQFK